MDVGNLFQLQGALHRDCIVDAASDEKDVFCRKITVGSSIAREADNVMYTWAGPEIAVATTKAYSTQLIAQYLLAMKFAKVRGTVSQNDFDAMIQSLERLPEQISLLLSSIREMVPCFSSPAAYASEWM